MSNRSNYRGSFLHEVTNDICVQQVRQSVVSSLLYSPHTLDAMSHCLSFVLRPRLERFPKSFIIGTMAYFHRCYRRRVNQRTARIGWLSVGFPLLREKYISAFFGIFWNMNQRIQGFFKRN